MDIISEQDCEALLDFLREIAAGAPLPSLDELGRMIACSFWASLEREEGRSVAFALVFGAGASPGEADLCLAEGGAELSSDEIVKLAPAVLTQHTGLRVQRSSDGRLMISGLTPLDGDALVLEAFAPGQLHFKMGNRTRALLRSGDVTFLADDHADNLLFLVNGVSEYGVEVNAEFVVVAQAFEGLLEAMMRHEHGGTLLWIPSDCEWEDGIKSIRFRCAEPYRALRRAVLDVHRAVSRGRPIESRGSRTDPARRLLTEHLRSIQDEIERVGQLTAVDGAVVIDDGLLVRGFGVMLRTESPGAEVWTRVFELGRVRQPDERLEFRETLLRTLGGARHRSAAEFCLTHPRCLAFVASQDGGLTIFGWQQRSERLFAIRHAELALL